MVRCTTSLAMMDITLLDHGEKDAMQESGFLAQFPDATPRHARLPLHSDVTMGVPVSMRVILGFIAIANLNGVESNANHELSSKAALISS